MVEVLTFFFMVGAMVSLLVMLIASSLVADKALDETPMEIEEFINPYGAKRIENLNKRSAAFDKAERSSKAGRVADKAARYLTFFGVMLAICAGIIAIFGT
ncbi:hypothetical protein [Aliiroseovarius sp. F20344]|uniref:hypothetical protein n=1 Tax=Aliiroseovarius sp. F20344 TaxID=2926414 RepID=UPI001FF12B6C|nr:hypothetical protein [Aliiroseovarius sp. F20344]MCK0141485.1 hypothetical protein [Aliiroseovarius sp. F20344]